MHAAAADHYQGITENWDAGLIYCSEITARLIIHMLGVNPTMVRRLPVDTAVTVQGAVTFAGPSCVSRRAGVCGSAAVEAQRLGWETGLRYPQVIAGVEAMPLGFGCH